MSNLFFLICWWIGVFTSAEPNLFVCSSVCSSGFARSYEHPVAKITSSGKFILFNGSGSEIVAIDLNTGNVKMSGSPNEAAKRFWKAVEQMKGEGK